MKTAYSFIIIPITILALFSCNKATTTPPPAPPQPKLPSDTLSAGWQKVNFPPSGNLFDMVFINTGTGYITNNSSNSSENGVYKTTDGGTSWSKLTDNFYYQIAATGDGKCFFVKAVDTIWKNLSGSTITPFALPALSKTGDIYFINNSEGFCAAQNAIYKTTDGGTTWVLTGGNFIPSGIYTSLYFSDATNGWMIADDKGLIKTNGSISSWVPVSFTGTSGWTGSMTGISKKFNNTMYACGNNGSVLKSSDGGSSFSPVASLAYFTSYQPDIFFVSETTGFVSTGKEIYKTTNGGASWTRVVFIGNVSLINKIFFIDENHGWACGSDGTFLKLN